MVEFASVTPGPERVAKLARYASVGVPEVWLLDVAGRTVEQYVQPRSGRYRASLLLEADEMITAATLSAVSLSISEIFG